MLGSFRRIWDSEANNYESKETSEASTPHAKESRFMFDFNSTHTVERNERYILYTELQRNRGLFTQEPRCECNKTLKVFVTIEPILARKT